VPVPLDGLKWAHIKFTPRSQEDFATVGVALTLRQRDGACEDLRLGLNSVGPKIFRARRSEEVVRGQRINEKLVTQMAEVAADEADPIEDVRGSADYKREMVKVMVRRAMQQALR